MKILFAGLTGVVGRMLLSKLINEGHEVIGMTHSERNKSVIENTIAKAVVADAFEGEAVLSAMNKVQPEVVIHQWTSLSNRNFLDNSTIKAAILSVAFCIPAV